MDTNVAVAQAPDLVPVSGLAYDGSIAALYRIFWRNLLLTIVTLGIFRFWAVTRTRRYLWSHMSFHDDRFEYTGTGREKLRGFAVAVVILGVLWGLNFLVRIAAPGVPAVRGATGLLYVAGLWALGQMAPFTAQRYRLARTQWRGIGGGMTGSAARYAVVGLLYAAASVLTLFLLNPLRRMRLIRRRVDASSFGDARLSFARESGLAVGAFLGAVGLKLAVFIGLVVAIAVSLAALHVDFGHLKIETLNPGWLLLLGFGSLIGFRVVNRLCDSWYDAAVLRRLLDRTRYLDLRLAARITGNSLFALRLGNAAIGLAMFGLGTPIVRQRCARFVANGIVVTGAFDVASLRPDTAPRARDAEGLLEAFDVGFLY